MLSEYQRHQVKGQWVDIKALCIFVLKIIDVLDSCNLTRDENKVHIHNMPQTMQYKTSFLRMISSSSRRTKRRTGSSSRNTGASSRQGAGPPS